MAFVGSFSSLGAERVVIAQFSRLRILERRREHVVAEPVAEPVVALLALIPVRHSGPQRHDADQAEQNQNRPALAIDQQGHDENQRQGDQNQVGEDRQAVLILVERLAT